MTPIRWYERCREGMTSLRQFLRAHVAGASKSRYFRGNPAPLAMSEGFGRPRSVASALPSPRAQGPGTLWVAPGMRVAQRGRDQLLDATIANTGAVPLQYEQSPVMMF